MRTRKPPRSREQYILDSLPEIFKGGEWVDGVVQKLDDAAREAWNDGKGGVAFLLASTRDQVASLRDSTSTRYMTIIGGQKIDEDSLYGFLSNREQVELVVGEGRGVETAIGRNYPYTTVVQVDPDRFGKNARKVNVEQVLCFAPDSPLLLVGDGTRVKQARDWLKRTLSRREVIELP